ncbi:MAG: translation elongation factor Ts [Phycisphaerales bacterium JB040]
MADISAKDVMALRNKTGLAMMACKKALAEAGGDPVAAEELLRKQLKGKMETKLDRAAGEGRIGVAVSGDGGSAAIVELKAETDFTAKNENFVNAVNRIAELALAAPAGEVSPTDEMTSIVDDLRASTGENISIGRMEKLDASGDATVFGTYVHHDGKTGVLIDAEGDVSTDTLRQVAMHVTAAVPRPLGVTPDEIPSDLVETERMFRIDQAVESGKPQEIAEKMVEGGMRKFFAEVALLEQSFVVEPSKTIKEVVAPGTIRGFRRWEVGETANAEQHAQA